MEFVNKDGLIKKVKIAEQHEIEFTKEIPDKIFREKLKEPLEKFEEGLESIGKNPVKEWEKVYNSCKYKGRLVLEAIAEEDGEASYSSLKKKLKSEGYEIKGRTFAGIFRGIHGHIADHISVVEDINEARYDFIPQEKRDGEKYRVISDEEYVEALKEALL